MKKRWLPALLAVMLLVAASGFLAIKVMWENKVYAGVAIEGVEVGGRSKEEVAQLLQVWQKEQTGKAIGVYYGDRTFQMDATSIDFMIDTDATLEEVWNFGRRGSVWEQLKNICSAERRGYRVPVRIRYNENKLNDLVDKWKESVEKPPRNAAFSILTGGIVPQEQGRKVEVDVLRPMVLQALKKPDASNVALPVTTLYPAITVHDIARTGIREMLASFTTDFKAEDKNRTANIKLAADKINGYIVFPGKTFSFNEIVGPREKKYGFKEAMEIVDGELVPGIGGGICQVSSTLYNAVLLADLAIAERYNHSKPLNYVALGRDATVAFGALDFKFTNNTDSPLMIMAETAGNQLTVGVFGPKRLQATVEIVSTEQRMISPAVVKQQDSGLYLGETKVDQQGKPGYEVTTVRVVKLQGKEIRREVLSKDQYLPDNTVVKVGTQLPPFAAER